MQQLCDDMYVLRRTEHSSAPV